MISVIVLEPRVFPRDDAGRTRVVRSLGWLVGAAVAGVVGDVVLAASPGLALSDVTDAVGARLVEADDEGERLRAAAAAVRCEVVLVMVAGLAADAGLVDELARGGKIGSRLLAEPATLSQRLLPRLAPTVGVLALAAAVRAAPGFGGLARANRAAPILMARARRLP